MSLRIQRSGADYSRRSIRAAAMDALEIAVEQWHDTMLPVHFTTAALAKYGYSPRTKKYMIRKARVMHHQLPLVGANKATTGESRAAAMHDIRYSKGTFAGHPGASVAMMMPGYFVQRPRSSSIDKPAELTRTAPDEVRQLGETVDENFIRNLGQSRISNVA